MDSNCENKTKKSAMGNQKILKGYAVLVYVLRQEQHYKPSLTSIYLILKDAQWRWLLLQAIDFIVLLPFLL